MTTNPTDAKNSRAERGAEGGLAERLRLPGGGELAELDRVWRALELAPPSPPPPGFAARVAARAAASRAAAASFGWGVPRLAGAVALAAGIALGALLSANLDTETAVSAASESDAVVEESVADASLAASYLDAVDGTTGESGTEDTGGGER